MSEKIRRANPRVEAILPVNLHLSGGRVIHGQVANLSLGGALILCSHPIPANETIQVELRFAGLKSCFGSIVEIDEIDDRGVVRATETAEVRWSQKDGTIGVRFVNLSSETRRFLGRLVKYFEKLKSDLSDAA